MSVVAVVWAILLVISVPAGAQEREPATTMSYRGAPWLDRTEREREERPEEVLAAMSLEVGDVVADIGVGSGFFARRIAARVGDEGRVYGVDIQPEMLEILVDGAAKEGIDNIIPVLGELADPKLPAGQIDWMLLVDVYHEFSDPAAMLAKMREALAPGGRVALVEYRLEDATGDHIYPDHRMSVRQVLAEWTAAGYELVELYETLPSQHLFILRDATATDGPLGPARRIDEPAPPLAANDLFAAVDAGLVEIEARGAGRGSVVIEIRNISTRPLVITASAGVRFSARGDHADMLARSDAAIVLRDDETRSWQVRAVAATLDAPIPEDDDRFDLQPETVDDDLTRVARAYQAGTYRPTPGADRAAYSAQSIGVAEAAVWIATVDPSFTEIADRIGDDRVPAAYAAAFGLVLCDRAGIDIRSTRLWADHEAVFERLQLPELQAWYAARR